MKIPLSILAIVGLSFLALWWLGPGPDEGLTAPRQDLPWQLTPHDDGSIEVFGLRLGSADLDAAEAVFGAAEGLAVFESEAGERSLEAYFGTVQFGPLKAKVVARLVASDAEMQALIEAAAKREGSPTGDWKYPLSAANAAAQQSRPLAGLTYIPTYGGLEADFFRARFGEPAAWHYAGETAVAWYYPDLGLTLVINSKDKEVLEYQPPRDFVVPDTVTWTTSRDGGDTPGKAAAGPAD